MPGAVAREKRHALAVERPHEIRCRRLAKRRRQSHVLAVDKLLDVVQTAATHNPDSHPFTLRHGPSTHESSFSSTSTPCALDG